MKQMLKKATSLFDSHLDKHGSGLLKVSVYVQPSNTLLVRPTNHQFKLEVK